MSAVIEAEAVKPDKPQSKAVAERKAQEVVAPPISEGTAIIQMIERVARDPGADIGKVRELVALRKEMIADEAKRAFDAALAKLQPELPTIERKGRITIRDKGNQDVVKQSTPYALFEDINEACRPKLAEHGFAMSFRTGLAGDGKIIVTGILSHSAGHREETTITLPHDSTGSKNAVQAVGSSTSYGKRYVMCALLNITTRGEDDDGKEGGDEGVITDEQADQIRALLTETKSNLDLFLKYVGAPSVSDIPVGKFDLAIKKLQTKKSRAAQGEGS